MQNLQNAFRIEFMIRIYFARQSNINVTKRGGKGGLVMVVMDC